jgi:hypothetical protein
MARRLKQLRLPFTAAEMLPGNVVVVSTADLDLTTDAGMETCLRRMLAVPLDQSLLLDFLIGRRRGDPHPSAEHAELHRLMALLNSRYRGRRFDFLGKDLAAVLFRQSVRTMPEWLGTTRAQVD